MTQRCLYLMRHGKARAGRMTDDFKRPLSPRGKQDVLSQLNRFRQPDGVRPDGIFCSTAVRACQTADLLKELFVGTPVFFKDSLYLAPTFRLMEVIRQIDPIFQRIMIIGHNPGLEQLIPILTEPDRRTELHPADCVVLTTEVLAWSQLTTGKAQFEQLLEA